MCVRRRASDFSADGFGPPPDCDPNTPPSFPLRTNGVLVEDNGGGGGGGGGNVKVKASESAEVK